MSEEKKEFKFEDQSKEFLVNFAEDAAAIIDLYYKEYLVWIGLPFIPEDLGFKEFISESAEGTQRVYNRDSVSITKVDGSKWMVLVKDEKPIFTIPNKFVAYQVFKSLGIETSHEDTTIPADEKISTYLQRKKAELRIEEEE